MDTLLQNVSDPALIAAIEANLAEETFAFGRYRPGAELHEDEELQWFITGLPSSQYNAVVRTSIVSENVDAKIDAVLALFKAHGVAISWAVTQVTQPADMATRLLARGFTRVHEGTGMAVDLQALHKDAVTPPSFGIEEVGDQKALQMYFRVSMRGFGGSEENTKIYYDTYTNIGFGKDAPWRHYIGWLNDEPVTVSSLLLHAGVAGIYGVTTIPEARRLGIGAAITLAPLREARRRGYHVGILAPSKMGLNVYRRLGFQEYCKMNVYKKDLAV
ncbi:MAG: GNAT family N-acetyltransferase [Ktedonobacteraceae bacterium]